MHEWLVDHFVFEQIDKDRNYFKKLSYTTFLTDFEKDESYISKFENYLKNAGLDIKLCEANSFSLNAREVNQERGLWTQSEIQALRGVRILSPEKNNSGVSGLQPGNKYTFIWTVSGECGVSSDEVDIVFSQKNPFKSNFGKSSISNLYCWHYLVQ